MAPMVLSFKQLEVYQRAFSCAMQIYDLTDRFPKDERFRLTSQIVRSSNSVCAGISEAWRRRRYKREWINKLNVSEGEASETQHWLAVALYRTYISEEVANVLDAEYEHILRQLVTMINQVDRWALSLGH